jgi:hypothetical protein
MYVQYKFVDNSVISCSVLGVFPIIEFLLPGQKFISTLLSDILTILGIIWACIEISVIEPIASFHETQKNYQNET